MSQVSGSNSRFARRIAFDHDSLDDLFGEFRLFGDVDPNKIFLMGYSHGGYGAFAIGPKMPDQFAAIHSSAAAPTR